MNCCLSQHVLALTWSADVGWGHGGMWNQRMRSLSVLTPLLKMGSSHCGTAPVWGCLPFQGVQFGFPSSSSSLWEIQGWGLCAYVCIFFFWGGWGNWNKLFEKITNEYVQLVEFSWFPYCCLLPSSALASPCFLCSTSFPGRTEPNSLQVPLLLSLLQPGLTGGGSDMAKGGGTCREAVLCVGLWPDLWCRRRCDGSPPAENNPCRFLIGQGGWNCELQICRKPSNHSACRQHATV